MEASFLHLIQAHAGILHKVCNLYCPNSSDRQDLLQEMLLQLWKAFPGYRQEAKLSTWMYRVVLNTAITYIRAEKRKAPSQSITEDVIIPEETDNNLFIEQWDMLKTAMTHLTDIEKAIIILYLEKKTYAEMEEVLGVSQGALRVKMNRIKEKLKQNINAQTN